jgi:hypothetical protein
MYYKIPTTQYSGKKILWKWLKDSGYQWVGEREERILYDTVI